MVTWASFSMPHSMNTLFVHLVNPGPFDPQESSTEAQINATCDVWKESHHTFHLCQAVEKALISQVVSAVEPSGTDEVMTSIYCDVYSYT